MTENLLDAVQETLLMGPGPSCVAESVYAALARKTLGHLDRHLLKILDAIQGQFREVFGTANALTIPISGTGSAGMEMGLADLVEPGDAVPVRSNGVFGMRMQDVAAGQGAKVDALEFDWGTPHATPDWRPGWRRWA